MSKILIKKEMTYDEDLLPVILPGIYNYVDDGINEWPMVEINGEWWDWAADPYNEMWEVISEERYEQITRKKN